MRIADASVFLAKSNPVLKSNGVIVLVFGLVLCVLIGLLMAAGVRTSKLSGSNKGRAFVAIPIAVAFVISGIVVMIVGQGPL